MSPVFTRIRDRIECLNKSGFDVTFNMYNNMKLMALILMTQHLQIASGCGFDNVPLCIQI